MEDVEAGIFTCDQYIFHISCVGGHFVIMDTHRIGELMGGRGGGIVEVFDKEDNPVMCVSGSASD